MTTEWDQLVEQWEREVEREAVEIFRKGGVSPWEAHSAAVERVKRCARNAAKA